MEIASIIISIISLMISSMIALWQLKYTRNQDKLNALLRVKEERELESLNDADICAEIIQSDKFPNYIRISNTGKCIANDVDLTLPENDTWKIFKDKLPINLHPQQKIDLPFVRFMNSPSKQCFHFSWKDKKGSHEKYIELA